MKQILLFAVFLICFQESSGQWVSFGNTFGIDFYQFQQNPESHPLGEYRTGSALTNFNWGPKMWLGKGDVNMSLEAQVSYAPFAFDVNDYKGLGAISFPLVALFNFNGVSTTTLNAGTGFSIGGGVVFANTDLYFLSDDYSAFDRGDRQQFFPSYFGEVGLGFGALGFSGVLYGRYGQGPNRSMYMSIGFMINVNSTASKNLMKEFSK